MKTLQQMADDWIEQYAFQVPFNTKGPIANEDYYDKNRLQHGRAGFLAGYEAAHKELESLRKFKSYVHARLDAMGVPADPEPENNAKHGCRIEGRLNWVQENMFEV
jgi:hypothetical protein